MKLVSLCVAVSCLSNADIPRIIELSEVIRCDSETVAIDIVTAYQISLQEGAKRLSAEFKTPNSCKPILGDKSVFITVILAYERFDNLHLLSETRYRHVYVLSGWMADQLSGPYEIKTLIVPEQVIDHLIGDDL